MYYKQKKTLFSIFKYKALKKPNDKLSYTGIALAHVLVRGALVLENAIEVGESGRGGGQETENALDDFKLLPSRG